MPQHSGAMTPPSAVMPFGPYFDGADMTGYPKLLRSRSRLLVALSLFVSPILAQQSPPPTKAVLLVDTDDSCRLLIDDEDKGVLSPNHSQKFNVALGEHLLKCTVEAV